MIANPTAEASLFSFIVLRDFNGIKNINLDRLLLLNKLGKCLTRNESQRKPESVGQLVGVRKGNLIQVAHSVGVHE